MSTKLGKLLTLLSDEEWHSREEVAKALQISEEKAQIIMQFLAEADLVTSDMEKGRIKLNQNWKTLLISQKEQCLEEELHAPLEKMAVGTIIIPPQKTLKVQNTEIANLTDMSLELEIRVDRKLREIAISKVE